MSKKRNPKQPPGTWVEKELYMSKAFHALKGFAPQLLILFLGKRQIGYEKDRKGTKVYKCKNCDSLIMTYKELKQRYGITQPRFTRALDELLAKGFIEIRHQGGAYKKDKSIYALSEKFKIWRPGAIFDKRAPDVRRGFQGKIKKPISK